MTKLHIFDMDGTLLTGSACLEVSRHMGQIDAVNLIEEAWGRGEVGHVEFYELCLPLWEGLTAADIDEVFRVTPWLDGIEEVWRDIERRGEHSAVISLSPQFFVDRLLPWGVVSAHGARVEAGLALDPTLVLTPEAKVVILGQLMERYGISEEDCVAYGDSASDLPLFNRLRNTVAINGSEAIRAAAAARYDGSDLREAYALGRALIDGTEPSAAPRGDQRAGTAR
ncbi:MAG: Haloacid dehalogenase domain protein hydrolase [Frankiales bacterium]|jgi:phosphoserine phosphatase|nr:Haloacid dehalogenase domain protein hydrolase [Frankiales bacterium]